MGGWAITTHCSVCDSIITNFGSGVRYVKGVRGKNLEVHSEEKCSNCGEVSGWWPRSVLKKHGSRRRVQENVFRKMCPRTHSKKVDYLCSRDLFKQGVQENCAIHVQDRFDDKILRSVFYTVHLFNTTCFQETSSYVFMTFVQGCAEGSPCEMCPTKALHKLFQERACSTDVLIYFVWGTSST